MPHSVKVNPVTGASITKKQLKKQLTTNNYGVKPSKEQLKSEWRMQGILAVPHFRELKPALSAALNNRTKRRNDTLLLTDEEWLADKSDPNSRNYYEDHSRWDYHFESFERDVTVGNVIEHRLYERRSSRSARLAPWSVTPSYTVVSRQYIPSGNSSVAAPRFPGMPMANRDPPSFPAVGIRDVPGPQSSIKERPVYRSPAYVPSSVSRQPLSSASGDSASFSYAPFRSFNQPLVSARKRRATSPLRYSDLYPNERECVRTKLGGWALFKLLPYSQQISALRTCLRSSRY